MSKLIVKDVRYELVNSILKGYKEVRILFNYKGKEQSYFIYLEEDKGVNYLNQAKKQFAAELKSGEVAKALKANSTSKPAPWLVATTCVLGAAAIALGGVLTYKYIADNNVGAVEYLNNATKVTRYTNDKLVSEETIQYNNAWYRTGSVSKAYDPDTGELKNAIEYNCKLDNKNRVVEGETIYKDASGEISQKNIIKCTFETDDKGTEYSENQQIVDGVVVEASSSYDEYETTYSVEGKRQINNGEDRHYLNGKLVERKTRTGDGMIANKGYDAPSKSEGKRYKVNEDGTETLIEELYSETQRTAKSRTTWDCDLKKYNYTKELIGGEWVKSENLTIGSVECTEDGLSIYEELRNYSDKEATVLKDGRKTMTEYDIFNREMSKTEQKLKIIDDKERWIISSTSNNFYHNNDNEPYAVYRSNYNDGVVVDSSDEQRELDKYGRITCKEQIATKFKSGGRVETVKNVIKYEYGKPVPLGKDREQMI